MTPRRSILQAATPLAIATALTFTSGWALAQSTQPVHGGTLRAIVQPEPIALNTTFNTTFVNGIVTSNILEGLLTYDENQQPRPGLATQWEVSPDGLTITYRLRKGVKWHDGQPFTSADVKFSALQAWKVNHPIGRTIYAALADVETPDDYTAVFRFTKPSLVVLSYANAQGSMVLPRHVYEGTNILSNPANQKPIGTGAFRFKTWQQGQYIELERNPDYWDTGKPYLDRVIFRVIPDAGARVAAFESQEVDYAPFDAVAFSDVERLKKLPFIGVGTSGYSWESAYTFVEFNLRNPILANPKVRHAIAQAINVQGLINAVWFGFGKPSTGPIPSTLKNFYTTQGVPQYPYDWKKAEALLDEAGYPRRADGTRFSLNFDYQPFHQTFKQQADYIKQNLKRVGIEVNVRNQDLPTFTKRVYDAYDFDLNTGRWGPMMDPQIGVLRHYWTRAISKGTPWTNASGYSNPQADGVIEALIAEGNPARRVALFHQLQRIAQTDLPVIPLFEQRNFTIYNTRVHGLSNDADAAQASLKSVWLSPP